MKPKCWIYTGGILNCCDEIAHKVERVYVFPARVLKLIVMPSRHIFTRPFSQKYWLIHAVAATAVWTLAASIQEYCLRF